MTYDTINYNMRVLINMLLCLANYKSPQLAHSLTIRFAFIYRHHQSCLIDFKCYLFSPKIINWQWTIFGIFQKVRYQMFHNDSNTHYDSVIRTCSSSKCSNMAEDEYNRCLLHPRDYWFQGCSLRSCCKDRDLCNAGSAPGIQYYLIYTTITMQILLLVTWPEGYSCLLWFFKIKNVCKYYGYCYM